MMRQRRPSVGSVEVTLEPHGVYVARCGGSPIFVRVDPFQAAYFAVRDRRRRLQRDRKRRGRWNPKRSSVLYKLDPEHSADASCERGWSGLLLTYPAHCSADPNGLFVPDRSSNAPTGILRTAASVSFLKISMVSQRQFHGLDGTGG